MQKHFPGIQLDGYIFSGGLQFDDIGMIENVHNLNINVSELIEDKALPQLKFSNYQNKGKYDGGSPGYVREANDPFGVPIFE